MVRLWYVTNGDARYWRASLHDVRTGERRGFAGLDEAMAFLRQELERLSDEGLADLEEGRRAEYPLVRTAWQAEACGCAAGLTKTVAREGRW